MPDILQCEQPTPHQQHSWRSVDQNNGGLSEYHVCPGLSTALDGATDEPAPEMLTGTVGEFAARWNARPEHQREALWRRIVQAGETATNCWMRNHEGLQEELNTLNRRRSTARSEIQGLLDSLDSHVTHDEIYSQLKAIQEAL